MPTGSPPEQIKPTSLDDYLEATGSRATLSYAASSVSVSEFTWVGATSSSGSDTKVVETIDFILELLGAWMDA